MNEEHLKFTKEHEWINKEGLTGISDYAQKELGDVVFVELPKIGDTILKGKEFATLESVKAVSNVYAPVSGKIIDINAKLSSKSELINNNPYGDGWIIKIEIKDPKELDSLMDVNSYNKYLNELHSSH